ncbi:MAG TPA: hypothetical protein VGE54_09685 [Brevundimonas sp.]
MAGNQDRAARAEAWEVTVLEALAPMIDEAVAALKAAPLEPGDVPAVEKRARAIGVIARSARAVAALAGSPRRPSRAQDQEDEMGEHERDDSPENLARLRAELESRLDCLHAVIEKKRLAGWTVTRATAPGDGEPLRAA